MSQSNEGKFKFLEPNSYDASESKLERIWKQVSGAFSIVSERTQQYSAMAGMTYSPAQYVLESFSIGDEMPNVDWVKSNFETFVRGEMGTMSEGEVPSSDWRPNIVKQIDFSESAFNKLMLDSEYLEDFRTENLQSSDATVIAKNIYDILCSADFGSNKNRENNDLNDFLSKIVPRIEAKERLLFVCPGFPFKDQNRFRVLFDGKYCDMAEISFMKRITRIVTAIYQVHPYGADIVILSDGSLYHDIFGVEQNVVDDYKKNLLYYRNKLNIQGSVSIISLKEMIDRASTKHTQDEIKDYIKSIIRQLISSDFREQFEILKQGMKWNYNNLTNPFFQGVTDQECWQIIRCKLESVPIQLRQKWKDFDKIAEESALEYASVNLMLKYTDLIKKFFPNSIRGTIHPKRNQFALNNTISYAWNGIAYSEKWPTSIKDIQVKPIIDLAGKPLCQVLFEYHGLPAFYTSGVSGSNIEKAKNVLPSYAWNIPGTNLSGRRLKPTDLGVLCALGHKDKDFIWERQDVDESYFQSLLQFRINHYEQYGFGVYGIWQDGILIGQCGLQVNSIENDEVEFVIFLGKKYVHQGIGSVLTNYIINACKEHGMTKLLGIVRVENDAAIKFFEKRGIKSTQSLVHYRYPAVVYRLI